jgi:hypothetical protein
MWNLANKGYVGKTVGAVMDKWSGGYRGVPGPAGEYPANMKITQAMLNDPNFMIPFMQAVASGEAAGGQKVLSQEQWKQAYDWYQKGGVPQAGEEAKGGAPIKAPGPVAAPPTASMEDAMMKLPGGPGSSLNRQIKEMNLQQRTSGATGGQNIAMNAPITVNGVAPGRESLMAKKTALALRDPTAQLLTEIKRARSQESRLGYV